MTSRFIGYLTIDQKGRTTIPQRIREELQLGEDSLLRIERTESGAIELVPSVSIPQDQLWYHSAEGRARIEEAEAVFERLLWMSPSDNLGIRILLPRVKARKPWTADDS